MGKRKSGGQCGDTLESMKVSYKEARAIGDRGEESRWANQIGHAYKERGEYVEALKWFRLDYDIASGRKASGIISPAGLMPTCQCLGEIFLRMQNYKEALIYQEKHFKLAEEAGDLIEQQRASTQLGRTYLDLYDNRDEEDSDIPSWTVIEKCRKFVTASMELAKRIAELPPGRNRPSSVKELIDAYNNMGLMKMVFEDPKQAEKFFFHALKICDDEEVMENDDTRSRIHCNIGRLYSERRDWQNAKVHMQLDIKICKVIGNLQGEVKGLVNFGQLSFKRQNYEDAMKIYKRALAIVEKLEDEDALAATVRENIRVVKEAEKNMKELSAGILQLQKLQRDVESSRGTSSEVKCLKTAYILLGELTSQAEILGDWDKFLELSKKLKRVSQQLGDSGKIGDGCGMIGQAYYQLRLFEKAKKWHLKSFNISKRAKHLEGQAVAKINYGNALDANGEWEAAFKAYEEAYELSLSEGEKKMLEQQKSALENMQYACNVRFEDFDQARDLESKLYQVRRLIELSTSSGEKDVLCSETDSEPDDRDENQSIPVPSSNSRKRHHIVLSDDEEEDCNLPAKSASRHGGSDLRTTPGSPEVVLLPEESPRKGVAEFSPLLAKDDLLRMNAARTPSKLTGSSNASAHKMDVVADSHECPPCSDSQTLRVNVSGHILHVNLKSLLSSSCSSEHVTVEMFLEEVLRLYKSAKPKGPHPILGELLIGDILVPSDNIYDLLADIGTLEVAVTGWTQVPFMERYNLVCKKNKFPPNSELQNKLKLETGQLEACDCDLDDASVWHLLLALDDIGSFFSVKLAHNRLGRLTALQKVFGETNTSDTGLSLDFHDNKLAANSLCEVSKCGAILPRLERLVLSRNLLTDGVAHDLARIIQNAPRLHTLELEGCGLTTLTCQKLTNALQAESYLQRLSIARNNPIAGFALKGLLNKLASLLSFMALDISGLQVCAAAGIEGIVNLVEGSNTLSVLLMRELEMRPEFWIRTRDAISKNPSNLSHIDVANCKIVPEVGQLLYTQLLACPALSTLVLAGNHLNSQSVSMIVQELVKESCELRKLDLSDCDLSQDAVLTLLESLRGNSVLAELRLAGNCRDAMKKNSSSSQIVADSEDEDELDDETIKRFTVALSSSGPALKVLDLSRIDILPPAAVVTKLYSGWSTSKFNTEKHVQGNILHFSVNGIPCCQPRGCC